LDDAAQACAILAQQLGTEPEQARAQMRAARHPRRWRDGDDGRIASEWSPSLGLAMCR
jgi:hypothetical protein